MSSSGAVLLDGGLSTALGDRGIVVGGELWTGELLRHQPDVVADAHRDFVSAGAEVIITGSYQLSFDGCSRAGWADDEIVTALRNSTVAARMAAMEETLVAASVGPYGAFLADGSEFRGAYGVTRSRLREFHQRRLEELVASEPDLLAIETQPDFDEIDVVLDIVSDIAPDMPFWVSCTVTEPGRIAGGAPWEQVVNRVAGVESAIAVGINCSAIEVISPTLQTADTDLPFVIYPNLGQQWDGVTDSWSGPRHDVTEELVTEWVSLGARLIGGCCGFGRADIAALGRLL